MHLSLLDARAPARFAAMVLALVAVAIAAGPVAAATPPTSDYGNTVECRYRTSGHGPAYDWRLKRFVVTPPVLYAKQQSQVVSWRFVVERSIWMPGAGPWEVTYRSPIEKRTATRTVSAAFTTHDVDVVLPNVENKDATQYRVTLKFAWYHADGSVGSRASYLMPWMKSMQYGKYIPGDYVRTCSGGYYEGP